MIGRSGLHRMLRNAKISPWTRRSLTERFLLNRNAPPPHPRKDRAADKETPQSASSRPQSWIATISSALRKSKGSRS